MRGKDSFAALEEIFIRAKQVGGWVGRCVERGGVWSGVYGRVRNDQTPRGFVSGVWVDMVAGGRTYNGVRWTIDPLIPLKSHQHPHTPPRMQTQPPNRSSRWTWCCWAGTSSTTIGPPARRSTSAPA